MQIELTIKTSIILSVKIACISPYHAVYDVSKNTTKAVRFTKLEKSSLIYARQESPPKNVGVNRYELTYKK